MLKSILTLCSFRLGHAGLYGALACTHCALLAEAIVASNWLAAVCSLIAGVSYILFASHSWAERRSPAAGYGDHDDPKASPDH